MTWQHITLATLYLALGVAWMVWATRRHWRERRRYERALARGKEQRRG